MIQDTCEKAIMPLVSFFFFLLFLTLTSEPVLLPCLPSLPPPTPYSTKPYLQGTNTYLSLK